MRPYYEDDSAVIYCGDCREVLPTLEAGGVDLVLTDPQYGDDHDTDYTRFQDGSRGVTGWGKLRKTHKRIHGDEEPVDPAWLLAYGNRQIIFGYNRFASALPVGSLLVWDKRADNGHALLSDGEVAWYSRGRGVYIFDHCWQGFSRSSENSEHYHPTQKPVALMMWCLQKARASGLVVDPYAGSGPVGLACKQLGLPVVLIEIEERYCEIAARRLMNCNPIPFPEPEPVPVQAGLFSAGVGAEVPA